MWEVIMKTLAIVTLTMAGILAGGAFAQGVKEYQGPVVGPPKGMKLRPTKLACAAGSGDVVAVPQIKNQGPWVLKTGMRVEYTLTWANGAFPQVTRRFALPKDVSPGGWVAAPKAYPVHYACTARLVR